MIKFLKAFLAFGLATSLEKLLGFIIIPIYTDVFTVSEYGIIDMIGTIISVAMIFGLLQLETALQRYYYDYKGVKRKLLVSNTYFGIGILSVFTAFLLFALSDNISIWLFKTDSYSTLIKLSSLQIPIQNLSMLGLVLLRFDNKNIKFLIVIILKVLFTLSCVMFFVVKQKGGLQGVFLAQLVAQSATLLAVFYFVRENFVFHISRIFVRMLFSYSLPQFPARIGSMSIGEVNRFFMLHFLSLQTIGIFSVSFKVASAIQLLNMAFIMAWTPLMHSLFNKDNNKKIFSLVFLLVCCATFLFVCLIALFSKEMIKVLVSQDFLESYKYVGGLSLFFALYIVKEVVDVGPKITRKTQYLSYNFLISVMVNIISLYFFIKFYELEGVIFAMVLTNLVLVIISWYTSNKLYYIPFNVFLFCILFFPAVLMSLLTMNYNIDLWVRVSVAIVICIFYGLMGLYYFKEIRTI